MFTKTDLKMRTFRWGDLPAVVDLINLHNEAMGEEERENVQELEQDWRTPNYYPERDYHVVETPDGQMVAFSFIEPVPSAPNKAYAFCVVHPEFMGQGIGTDLIQHGDKHFMALSRDIPEDKPLYVQRWTSEREKPAIALIEAQGYTQVRTFYEMRITLNGPVPPVEFPEGFALRPFNPETDARAVHLAHQESFRDHWGYTADTDYEQWAHQLAHPDFDPDLYLAAYEGEDIAGIAICRPWGPDQPQLGWVNILGVRKAWRKRRLASALLRHAFYVFQQRGFAQVGLGVDGASKTNAVALYERNGMHIHKQSYSFRKVLRGSAEAIQD